MAKKFLNAIGGLLVAAMTLAANGAGAADPENTIIMELKTGRVVIELRPDLAPNHVKRIKELTREKFYDGIVFHRVIAGFMAQTGDPTGTGAGGSKKGDLNAEFNNEPHVRGTLSMARAQSPNSADSQFFIVFADARFLDKQYTVWGKVIEGMDNVDKIKKGDAQANGQVTDPDRIITMRVAADVK
jgi:peptidylprolyl isomerase